MTNTIEQHKHTVRRFLEGTHSGRHEVVDETVHPAIVTHGFPGGNPDSRETYKAFFAAMDESLRGMDFRIDAMIGEGDQVAVRFTVEADHAGEFMGVPATGRRVRFGGMVIYRLLDGLIAETWLLPDGATLLQQMGVLDAA